MNDGKIPEHMQDAVTQWVQRGLPHPDMMGAFFRAVLENDFIEAFARADEKNLAHMHGWAKYLYNDMPAVCRGTRERMIAWHERGGLDGKS